MTMLDKGQSDYHRKLHEIGLYPDGYHALIKAGQSAGGFIFIVGPAQSGKTTTLNALCTQQPDRHRIAIQKSVAHRLPGVEQVQIYYSGGYDFSTAIIAALQHKPDTVLIDEICDASTARLAFEHARATGRQIIASISASTRADAIEQLRRYGISQRGIADALNSVCVQRLARRLCPHCKATASLLQAEHTRSIGDVSLCEIIQNLKLKKLLPTKQSTESLSFYTSHGCGDCNESGFFGHVGIFEVTTNGDTDVPIYAGITTLAEDAVLKALAGLTSIAEVDRVLSV